MALHYYWPLYAVIQHLYTSSLSPFCKQCSAESTTNHRAGFPKVRQEKSCVLNLCNLLANKICCQKSEAWLVLEEYGKFDF